MGVMLQAFYWDCPEISGQEHLWWDHIRRHVVRLAGVGFTSLWLPPPHKAQGDPDHGRPGVRSIGYDPRR